MTSFNLMDLTESHPLVKRFKQALEKGAGQIIPIINIEKVRRIAGTSVRPVQMVFAGGQTVTLLFRSGGDVFRVQVNGKDLPMIGDLSPDYGESFAVGIEDIAKAVRSGQKSFEKKQSRQKVVIPNAGRATLKNTSQLLKQALADVQANDEIIKQKKEARDALLAQLEQKMQQQVAA